MKTENARLSGLCFDLDKMMEWVLTPTDEKLERRTVTQITTDEQEGENLQNDGEEGYEGDDDFFNQMITVPYMRKEISETKYGNNFKACELRFSLLKNLIGQLTNPAGDNTISMCGTTMKNMVVSTMLAYGMIVENKK